MQPRLLTILTLAALLLAGALFLPDQPRPAQAAAALSEYANLLAFYRETGGRTHWRPECRRQWLNERAELRPGESAADYPSSVLTLSGGQAVAIRLRDCGLTGRIPAALTQLTRLKILDLSDNDLSGPIPPEMENLDKLMTLDFSGNKLNGEIPGQIGNIPNLERLRLNNNRLRGNLPIQLGNLIRLKELNVTRNQLTGIIPPTFKNLFTIEAIYLQNPNDDNTFYGCIDIEPKNSDAGVPYCQRGSIPTPVPTRVPFPTPTYTPVPTYTPRPTWTPVPTRTPVPTWTPVPTATPEIRPVVNLTATRREVPFGEPVELNLTLTNRTLLFQTFKVTLNAPTGVTFAGDPENCSPNLCIYRGEMESGELHPFSLQANASEPGEVTITGEVAWWSGKNRGKPLNQPMSATVTVLPAPDPVIRLHATQTREVRVGDDVSLTLTVQSPLGRPAMRLSLDLPVPEGWHIKQLEAAESCTNSQCNADYTVETGKVRHISFVMAPNQPGPATVVADIKWYFDEDDRLKTVKNEQRTLEVTAGPRPTPPPTPSPVPTPPPSPNAPPADNPEPPPSLTPTTAPAFSAIPRATPLPTATPTPPPANAGGNCNPPQAGRPTSGGDMAWLLLPLLGIAGWRPWKSRR